MNARYRIGVPRLFGVDVALRCTASVKPITEPSPAIPKTGRHWRGGPPSPPSRPLAAARLSEPASGGWAGSIACLVSAPLCPERRADGGGSVSEN